MIRFLLSFSLCVFTIGIEDVVGQDSPRGPDPVALYAAILVHRDSTHTQIVQVIPEVIRTPQRQAYLIRTLHGSIGDRPAAILDPVAVQQLVDDLTQAGVASKSCLSGCPIGEPGQVKVAFASPRMMEDGRASVRVRFNGINRRSPGSWINDFVYRLDRRGHGWIVVDEDLVYDAHAR